MKQPPKEKEHNLSPYIFCSFTAFFLLVKTCLIISVDFNEVSISHLAIVAFAKNLTRRRKASTRATGTPLPIRVCCKKKGSEARLRLHRATTCARSQFSSLTSSRYRQSKLQSVDSAEST